jgi:serine/threonine-protein kinase ULK/ATG1
MKTIIESGQNIGNYKLIEMIGKGSFATVYQAIHIPTNSIVAVKTIRKDDFNNLYIADSFLKEIEITRSLHHPFIAQLFDFLF